MGQSQYREMEQIQNIHDYIHNCQVLHYSRISPHTREVAPWFTHMRSVCPWDLSRSRNIWVEIQRPKYDTWQLMQQVSRVHRVIDDDVTPPARPWNDQRPLLPEGPKDTAAAPTPAAADRDGPAVPDRDAPASPEPSFGRAARAGASTEVLAGAHHVSAALSKDRKAETETPGRMSAPKLQGSPSRHKPLALPVRNVTLISKSTRLEQVGASVLEVGDTLAARLRDAHARHAAAVALIESVFRSEGAIVNPIAVQNARPEVFHDADLVVCAGGDGTFLSTAANLSRRVPVLGINTDPERSTGALTTLSFEHGDGDSLARAIERLRQGNYELQPRRRLVVSVRPVGGSEYLVPRLALNDVFVSERATGRVYACEAVADTGPIRVRRSSGILFSTGTGSTARMRNTLRIDSMLVEHVLREAAARGDVDRPRSAERPAMPPTTECMAIAETWSKRWELAPDANNMVYSILEPMTADCAPRGRVGNSEHVVVRSLGHQTVLTLDGFYEHPIRYGDEVTISVGDQDTMIDSVHLPSHDIYLGRRGRERERGTLPRPANSFLTP